MLYTFAKKCISEEGEVEPVKIKKLKKKLTWLAQNLTRMLLHQQQTKHPPEYLFSAATWWSDLPTNTICSGMLADTFIWPHVQMLRSLKASSFPFDSTKSAISPPSEWLAPPFSGFLAIWACTELDAAELHLPSKYVEQGKYWAQRNFHPVKKKFQHTAAK